LRSSRVFGTWIAGQGFPPIADVLGTQEEERTTKKEQGLTCESRKKNSAEEYALLNRQIL
jgi:hypothetical protein